MISLVFLNCVFVLKYVNYIKVQIWHLISVVSSSPDGALAAAV